MDQKVRQWIVSIIESRTDLMGLAARQRAKFEGWLKFEVAGHALRELLQNVELEAPYHRTNERVDLAVTVTGVRYYIELKTANTNWRMGSIENRHRPITKNVKSIIEDAKKLRDGGKNGVMAFVLFPVPVGDNRWHAYLDRISTVLGIALTEEQNCSRVRVSLVGGGLCEMVVCCFNLH